ncbi:MAG TPA: energy transducer TonB [Bryobacteraceae bacterium]|nr:energy transducer TonB [Bryobacteraceae bacterium]
MEPLTLTETAATIPEPELNLLLERDDVWDGYRYRYAAAGSVFVHILLILVALSIRESPYVPRPERIFVQHVTPLYTPPELTQRSPNKSPVSKELTVESIAPRPQLKAPAPAPAAAKPQVAKIAPPVPTPPTPKEVPRQVAIELPKTEAPVQGLQATQLPKSPTMPAAVPDKPKLALENANSSQLAAGVNSGRGTGLIQVPSASIQDAVKNLSRSQGSLGAISIGDIGSEDSGIGPGLNLPPSAGRPRSNLELKSDPMGVDFRPYMLQVIAAIRRNWFAVYPEAARLGQRGQVVLQFAIAKQGIVTKVIFSGASGAKALDQSAVAAISASNPLPPLPADFKGDRIILQMTFLYNMPR